VLSNGRAAFLTANSLKFEPSVSVVSFGNVVNSPDLCPVIAYYRVTTCLENLENLEMSGNLKHVREMSGMLLTVREMSGKKSCHGKVFQNCSLLDEYLHSYGYLVAVLGTVYLNISITFKNSA